MRHEGCLLFEEGLPNKSVLMSNFVVGCLVLLYLIRIARLMRWRGWWLILIPVSVLVLRRLYFWLYANKLLELPAFLHDYFVPGSVSLAFLIVVILFHRSIVNGHLCFHAFGESDRRVREAMIKLNRVSRTLKRAKCYR